MYVSKVKCSYSYRTLFRSGKMDRKRAVSLDRKKALRDPKLLQSSTVGPDTIQIYAQSATDYSDDDDNATRKKESLGLLDVPAGSTLRKSKSFAASGRQFEGTISADEVDEKKRTMMAFFSSSSPSPGRVTPSSSSRGSPSAHPTATAQSVATKHQVLERQDSITSEDILGPGGEGRPGDDEEEDVDAVFESLLNNTYDDRVGQGQGQGAKSTENLAAGQQAFVGGRGGRGRFVPRQQTWAGPSGSPPPAAAVGHADSPSPTLSEYDTPGVSEDAWEDY